MELNLSPPEWWSDGQGNGHCEKWAWSSRDLLFPSIEAFQRLTEIDRISQTELHDVGLKEEEAGFMEARLNPLAQKNARVGTILKGRLPDGSGRLTGVTAVTCDKPYVVPSGADGVLFLSTPLLNGQGSATYISPSLKYGGILAIPTLAGAWVNIAGEAANYNDAQEVLDTMSISTTDNSSVVTKSQPAMRITGWGMRTIGSDKDTEVSGEVLDGQLPLSPFTGAGTTSAWTTLNPFGYHSMKLSEVISQLSTYGKRVRQLKTGCTSRPLFFGREWLDFKQPSPYMQNTSGDRAFEMDDPTPGVAYSSNSAHHNCILAHYVSNLTPGQKISCQSALVLEVDLSKKDSNVLTRSMAKYSPLCSAMVAECNDADRHPLSTEANSFSSVIRSLRDGGYKLLKQVAAEEVYNQTGYKPGKNRR